MAASGVVLEAGLIGGLILTQGACQTLSRRGDLSEEGIVLSCYVESLAALLSPLVRREMTDVSSDARGAVTRSAARHIRRVEGVH